MAGIRESAADLCIGFDSGCTCPACWARAACLSVSLPEPVPPWPGGPVDRERWGSSADYRAGVED